jgi:hypothetical protein
MNITVTDPPLAPHQYPGANPYPSTITLVGSGADLHVVTYKVDPPANGLCRHGAPLYTAVVCVFAGIMKQFIDFYCAHIGSTTVTVTCDDNPAPPNVPPRMAWSVTP